jgi:hypothetical protein
MPLRFHVLWAGPWSGHYACRQAASHTAELSRDSNERLWVARRPVEVSRGNVTPNRDGEMEGLPDFIRLVRVTKDSVAEMRKQMAERNTVEPKKGALQVWTAFCWEPRLSSGALVGHRAA